MTIFFQAKFSQLPGGGIQGWRVGVVRIGCGIVDPAERIVVSEI